jgi:hypothetical protein
MPALTAACMAPPPLPPMPPATAFTPLMDLAQPASDRVVAVGLRGTLLWADANARPVALEPPATTAPAAMPMRPMGPPLPPLIAWQRADAPVDVTLTAVRFADAERGYAVGHRARVLRTDDGGRQWRAVSPPSSAAGDDMPWFDVVVGSRNDVLAVGAYGRAVRSRDGGSTWQAVDIGNPAGAHLYAADALGAARIVAGEQGFVSRSVDGGLTWSSVASPADGTWFGVMLHDGGGLTLHGLQGRVFHRDSDASPFHAVSVPTRAAITAVARLDPHVAVLVSQAGELFAWRIGERSARALPMSAPFPLIAATATLGSGKSHQLWLAGLRGGLALELPAHLLGP